MPLPPKSVENDGLIFNNMRGGLFLEVLRGRLQRQGFLSEYDCLKGFAPRLRSVSNAAGMRRQPCETAEHKYTKDSEYASLPPEENTLAE